MNLVKRFFKFETLPNDNCWGIIVPNDYDSFPLKLQGTGSYALAPARVLGLEYPTYLKFIRDLFPEAVDLRGKGHKYIVAYWKNGIEVKTFIRLLNEKLTLAMMEMGKNE